MATVLAILIILATITIHATFKKKPSKIKVWVAPRKAKHYKVTFLLVFAMILYFAVLGIPVSPDFFVK